VLQFFELQEPHPPADDLPVPAAPVLLKLKADISFFVFFDLHLGHAAAATRALTISSNFFRQAVQ
jgi:hypothetical protein